MIHRIDNQIEVSVNFLNGKYYAPASKSHTFRALFLSIISKKVKIYNILYNNDTQALLEIFTQMGANIEIKNNYIEIDFENIKILDFYDFKNSGTALRFMTTFLALQNNDRDILITGDEQLKKRKISPLLDSLEELGYKFEKISDNDLPFLIKNKLGGRVGIQHLCNISGKSSQFLSSLLLNLPFIENSSKIIVNELHEKPYINITLWWLDKFNIIYKNNDYKSFNIDEKQKLLPFEVKIPGDYSSAAFMILASALNGDVEINGLDKNDPQGDKFVLEFLKKIGFNIEYKVEAFPNPIKEGVLNVGVGLVPTLDSTEQGAAMPLQEKILGASTFKVTGSINIGGEFDLNDTPDLLPALALFSANFNYKFKFYNVESARYKETDRITSVVKLLESIGIEVNEFKDGLSFYGGLKSKINVVSAFNDHRLIMASSLLGVKKGYKVIIKDIKNVEGSYPNYFKDLSVLNVDNN